MPEDRKRFDLGDYVEVRDRIAILYERFPQARIETTYELTSEPDEKPKVICRAFVYRKPEDERPAGHGTSWLYLPGTTPYTRGSEVENAETSAVGRAIGMLGILIDKSIATSNEIENKREEPAKPKGTATEAGEFEPGALVGTVELSKDSPEFLPHVSAEGGTLTFKLRDKSGGIKVLVHGKLAYDLSMEKDDVVGQRATCFGAITDETFTPKGQTRKITYQVLTLSRIKVAGKEFPDPNETPRDDEPGMGVRAPKKPTPLHPVAAEAEPVLEEPPDDLELIGEVVP